MHNPKFYNMSFNSVDLSESFFDSLKNDYIGFEEWFKKKSLDNESLYITKNEIGNITGILYLKIEDEEHRDIEPNLPIKRRLKVGTLKIDAHGTNLGQYYISKILHEALYQKLDEVYVTIFPKHERLIRMVERYGFKFHGIKTTSSGIENVYIKELNINNNKLLHDYPRINLKDKNIYLLGIYPKWHTVLFGDSILKTEDPNELLQDISHTNSIHKVYICGMRDIPILKTGDILVIYRTADKNKSPYFSSVATSICVVTEYKNMYSYTNMENMIRDIERYSVFTDTKLRNFYQNRKFPHIIKMLYNVPLKKRITMQKLIDMCGLSHQGYWGFRKLTKEQFDNIIKFGGVDENFIIN